MKIDYEGLRPMFHGNYSTHQFLGLQAILAEVDKEGVTMREQVAYIFATVFHETGRHMIGVDEYGHGAGHPYGRADAITHKVYYGRGPVQLTWKANYQEFSNLLKIDLVNFPELCNDVHIGARIAILGMKEGLFTGMSLHRFINENIIEYRYARQIINGMDAADLIAGYAEEFCKHLIP